MRACWYALLALLMLVLPAGSGRAQSTAVLGLLLGDRACPDTSTGCTFADVVATYRYLHVVIHDEPHTYQWQIFAGADCDHLQRVAADGEIPASGYLEVVVDLEGRTAGASGCYVLRGDYGFSTTFYAAYLDDSASQDAAAVYPGYTVLSGRPDLPDLDVTSIARTPAPAYDATPNAPLSGGPVRFQATVVNSGALPSGPFFYQWTLDGRALPSHYHAASLAPAQSLVLSRSWRWDPAPHTLTLTLFPQGSEISTANDTLSIRTDALALGLWVEKSAYEFFRTHQWEYCQLLACTGSDSFEDWLQRQVSSWNGLLASARDPELAPVGVADRVRVQEIVIVPDGTLPLHGFAATNAPDLSDHSVDLEWGLPSQGIGQQMRLGQDGGFDIDWPLMHELGHARYLGDLYRFDVPVGTGNSVRVTATDGLPAINTNNPLDASRPLAAFEGERGSLFLYRNQEADIMSCDCSHFYSAYDAAVLNRIQGRRARCGNANPPCNLGEWFTEIPPENRIRVLSANGDPVPDGTTIRLYFDTSTVYNAHAFDDSHSLTLHTRAGIAVLPANPFAVSGPEQVGHNVLLIDVVLGRTDSFCFAEPTDFNVAYWEGYRTPANLAVYEMRAGPHPGNGCGLRRPPPIVNEPFATSPYASRVSLRGTGRAQRVRVRLVDGAVSANPMRHRQLIFRDLRGRTVASARSGENGVATARVTASDPPVEVVDLTDNGLVIPVRSAPAPRSSAPPR